MNVTVENLAPCKKLVRFEEDAQAVNEAFDAAEKEIQRKVSLPGFRPGKAPRQIVAKQYEKEIEEEAKHRLMSRCYQAGIKQQSLRVVNRPEIEEIQFGRGQNLLFAATVETAPEFELPEYRGLLAKRELGTVTEDDLKRAVEALQNQKAKFETVERPAGEGDIAVVNFTGTTDGKPIVEVAPAAQGLSEKKNFWVDTKSDSFLPGFGRQLIGAKAGDHKTIEVDFPADFAPTELAGKKGIYAVELVEVKIRVIPPIDDDLARSFGAENVAALHEGVRADLQNERNLQIRRSIRNQVVRNLLDRIQVDLPDSNVQNETRNIVYDIVSQNQKRGVPKDIIEKEKEEIYSSAQKNAKERVKAMYIFGRIAEKEGIRITDEDLNTRLIAMSQAYKMAPDKLVKELQKSGGLEEVQQQLLHEKVIDFLHENARIEDGPAPEGLAPV